ncbi:MAG: hypothetical protein ACREDR_07320, partial [Blastocatellia bacterium]
VPGDSGALVLTDPANEGLGLVMARAYSSGPFTPKPPALFAAPFQGTFVGYIVTLCSLVLVQQQLAIKMGLAPDHLTFSA